MRRFHVHIAVENLAKSKTFYSHLFGKPAVVKDDYAKWMLDDPPVNFAISTRGHEIGINHLGIEVDNDQDLRDLHDRLSAADPSIVSEDEASCCYARSDKYWVTDPNGVTWETFRTLADIPMFGTSRWDQPSTDGSTQENSRAASDSAGRLFDSATTADCATTKRSAENSCCGPSKRAVT